MRYMCVGSPHCMKTFEYGHALRAHVGACQHAQKVLRERATTEKLEHDISVNYPGVHGLHRNPYYPTHHHLDKTVRFQFADRYKFGSSKNLPPMTATTSRSTNDLGESINGNVNQKQPFVRLRKPIESNVHSSTQVKKLLSYEA